MTSCTQVAHCEPWDHATHVAQCEPFLLCQVSHLLRCHVASPNLSMCHPTPHVSKNMKSRPPQNPTKFDVVTKFREEQQSQQAAAMNLIAYRSMRDHIHPPRVSAPSCIIPPADYVVMRPYLVPLLPTFHGVENENPYTHIREFEEVCTTFKEGVPERFPLTLKDKAKIWLISLRPRTIRN